MGDIVDFGTGLSYLPASPCSPAGRYDNPMSESILSPRSGTMNLATEVKIFYRGTCSMFNRYSLSNTLCVNTFRYQIYISAHLKIEAYNSKWGRISKGTQLPQNLFEKNVLWCIYFWLSLMSYIFFGVDYTVHWHLYPRGGRGGEQGMSYS